MGKDDKAKGKIFSERSELALLLERKINEAKTTANALEKITGVSHTYIGYILKDEVKGRVSTKVLEKLAPALDADVFQFLKAAGHPVNDNFDKTEILADMEEIKVKLDATISKLKKLA